MSTSSEETPQFKPQITEKQAKRINAPARNMIISMVVMIAMLIPIMLLLPQLTNTKSYYSPNVDIAAIAYQAGNEAGYPVAAPTAEGWTYNVAKWNTNQADGIDYWSAGIVSPEQQYVAILQASDTNTSWIAQKTDNAAVAGQVTLEGVNWEIRTLTDKDGKTTTYYVGEVAKTTVILSADDATEAATIEKLASLIVSYEAAPVHTLEPTPTNTSGIQ